MLAETKHFNWTRLKTNELSIESLPLPNYRRNNTWNLHCLPKKPFTKLKNSNGAIKKNLPRKVTTKWRTYLDRAFYWRASFKFKNGMHCLSLLTFRCILAVSRRYLNALTSSKSYRTNVNPTLLIQSRV